MAITGLVIWTKYLLWFHLSQTGNRKVTSSYLDFWMILVEKFENTQYFNTFFASWKYWKYHYQYPILSFSSGGLILQCFLVDLFIFINQTVPLGYKLRSIVKTKEGCYKILIGTLFALHEYLPYVNVCPKWPFCMFALNGLNHFNSDFSTMRSLKMAKSEFLYLLF